MRIKATPPYMCLQTHTHICNNNYEYHTTNNDDIITRNDIIGTLSKISVTWFRNNRYTDTKNNGQ